MAAKSKTVTMKPKKKGPKEGKLDVAEARKLAKEGKGKKAKKPPFYKK